MEAKTEGRREENGGKEREFGEGEKMIVDDDDDDSDDGLNVPEGGWGWCVVLAGTICAMVVTTQGPCFGAIYGQRLDELGASPGMGAWLFNFQSLIWNLAGPWTGPLTEIFSYRQIGVFGAALVSLSYFLSALVTDPRWLYLTFSVFVGVGGGLSIMSCFHTVPQYFSKRLGLANGVMVAGGSLGIMVLPQLLSFLQEVYPFKVAAFIAGALMLNTPVLLLLLHPVSWHRKQTTPPSSSTSYSSKPSSMTSAHQNLLNKIPRRSSVPQELLKLNSGLPDETIFYRARRIRTGSECHHLPILPSQNGARRDYEFPDVTHLNKGNVLLGGSTLMGGSTMMGSVYTLDHQQDDTLSTVEAGGGVGRGAWVRAGVGGWARVWTRFRSQYNLSLIKDPYAAGLALATCLAITAGVNIFAATPFVLREGGYGLHHTATAMSVAAVVDLISRLLGSPLTDLAWVDARVMYGVGQLVFVITPFVLLSGLDDWWVVVVCMGVLGLGLGLLLVLDVLLVIKVLGAERLSSVFGLSQFFRCVFFSLLGPIGGELRKGTGDYTATLTFYASVVLLSLLLFICTILYAGCCTKPKTEQDAATTSSQTSVE